MKDFLLSTIILIGGIVASAAPFLPQPVEAQGYFLGASGKRAKAAGAAYLIDEVLDTLPTGWTVNDSFGSVTWGYASAVLGSCLRVPEPTGGDTDITSATFTATADVYVAFTFNRADANAAIINLITLRSAGDVFLARVEIGTTGTIVAGSAGTDSASAGTLSSAQKVWIKLRWNAGTSLATVWMSTDGTAWSAGQSTTGGADTDSADRIVIGNRDVENVTFEMRYLKVSASDIAIGDVEL